MRSKSADEIREAGLRYTHPRRIVASILENSKRPLTIEEIRARSRGRSLDRVTAYRVTDALVKAGLVTRIDLRHGHAHYERKGQRHHHHLVCTLCGKTKDFTGCSFEIVSRRALQQNRGFAHITDHSFEIFGVCSACASLS